MSKSFFNILNLQVFFTLDAATSCHGSLQARQGASCHPGAPSKSWMYPLVLVLRMTPVRSTLLISSVFLWCNHAHALVVETRRGGPR